MNKAELDQMADEIAANLRTSGVLINRTDPLPAATPTHNPNEYADQLLTRRRAARRSL